MSGHSKWSQIKRQKGLNDVKKGQIYTKVAKQIVLAVKQAGGDPTTNFSLRMAINKGKSVNMPSDNIEKAIKKGLGEDKNAVLITAATYEAYGIDGVMMLIDVLTDNRNRSAADVKMLVEKAGGRIVEAGAISWQFDTLGLITMISETTEESKTRLKKKWNDVIEQRKLPTEQDILDEFQLRLIDLDGIIDVQVEKEEGLFYVSIFTQLDKLDSVRKGIAEIGYDVDQAEIIKKPKEVITITDEQIDKNRKLIDSLEEYDDVDAIWTNTNQL